jgi:hypothetical protein
MQVPYQTLADTIFVNPNLKFDESYNPSTSASRTLGWFYNKPRKVLVKFLNSGDSLEDLTKPIIIFGATKKESGVEFASEPV